MIKKSIIFILIIAIIGFAIWLLTQNDRSTISNKFIVSDTAIVTKIFLADKNNYTLTLSRNEKHGWMINDSIEPIIDNVEILLATLTKTQIRFPVAEAAKNTAIKRLSSTHTKVEIYGKKPLFEIFNIKFFNQERLLNVFYVGGPTTDNRGTIMKAEGDDQVYVTFIPGFNGYLTERFSPRIADWKSHKIYSFVIGDLKKVRVDFPKNPKESYEIINNQNRTFDLIQLFDNQKIENYDTLRLLESLSAFNAINFETLLDGMTNSKVDSIRKQLPIRVLSIETIDGKKHKLTMYQRPNLDNLLDINEVPFPYDMDRLYGFINNQSIPVALQYFVIDNITRPLNYFTNRIAEKPQIEEIIIK